MTIRYFPPSVQKKLKYYVYVYVDPQDEKVFYVGKGVRNRAFTHLADDTSSLKAKHIRAIRRAGYQPRIDLLAHGLDERTALKLEAAAIDLIGKQTLTNLVLGIGSSKFGRMSSDQAIALYAPEPARFQHSAILLRINELFRYGMTDLELYDATRGYWIVDLARAKGRLVMPVFDRVIQEVYKVEIWLPAGSTLSSRGKRARTDKYHEFVGRIASPSIREMYLHKAVDERFAVGAQNPVRYIEPEVS